MFLLSLQSFGFRALLFFPGILFDPCLLSACSFLCSGDSDFPTSLFSRPFTLSGTRDKLEVRSSWRRSPAALSPLSVLSWLTFPGIPRPCSSCGAQFSISGHVLPSWFCSHVPSCSLVLRSRCFSVKMSTFAVSDQTVHHCSVSACSSSQSALSAQRYSQGRQWLSHRLNLLVSRPPWPVFWVCAWLDRHGIRPSYLGLGGPPLLGLGVRPPRSVSHLYPLLTLMLRVLRC